MEEPCPILKKIKRISLIFEKMNIFQIHYDDGMHM